MLRLLENLAEQQHGFGFGQRHFGAHARQRGGDIGGIGVGRESGRILHPAGFVHISGIKADGGEHIVKQHAHIAAEQVAGGVVFRRWANADGHHLCRLHFAGEQRVVIGAVVCGGCGR